MGLLKISTQLSNRLHPICTLNSPQWLKGVFMIEVIVLFDGVPVAKKTFRGKDTISQMQDWLGKQGYNNPKFDVRLI